MAGAKKAPFVDQRKDNTIDLGSPCLTDEQITGQVNLYRARLRAAIDESGLKHSEVAHAIRVPVTYLAKMLSLAGQQKPIGAHHVVALPPAVRRAFAAKNAEAEGVMDTFHVDFRASRRLVIGLSAMLSGLDRYREVK